MRERSLGVVIPTRNRATMAMTAIQHLLEQPVSLQIFVSDNSSVPQETALLADFCRALNDPRLTYWRVEENLGQGRHWDRAIRRAFAESEVTHVTIHYDRKITRPALASVWTLVIDAYPDHVITYVTDSISAEPPPLRLWQPPTTGKLYAIDLRRIVELTARGEALEIGHALPVLSNCLVPRHVVEKIVGRYGDLCVSTTADSCFTYRFAAQFDESLHLDRALTVLYGSHRSAGIGYLKGGGGDFADYLKTWNGEGWLDAAPLPGVNLGGNMLFHEYELVRRATGGDRLPPLDKEGCLRDLARGLGFIRDPHERAALLRLLREHGWSGDFPAMDAGERRDVAARARVRIRQALTLLFARLTGISPRSITGFTFGSDEEGLEYAIRYPAAPSKSGAHLALLAPRELEFTAP